MTMFVTGEDIAARGDQRLVLGREVEMDLWRAVLPKRDGHGQAEAAF
jgi:hypothetical protein